MSNLHLLPVAVFLLFQFTFIGTYVENSISDKRSEMSVLALF